jgi:hypothetical protein
MTNNTNINPGEMYQSGMQDLTHYCSTIVSCRYTLPPALADFSFHKEVIESFERGVVKTILQFPMLQV